jgi:muconolactone delta-isomerase
MAEYYFFVNVRVDVNKYPSGQALLDRWLDEAEAAAEAEQAGAIQSLWRSASEPRVYGVVKLEGENVLHAQAVLLEALQGLPMGQDGALIVEEASEVRPYTEWREFLRQRARSRTQT